jgi:Putative zinc finger motif, C2HC5-type
MRSESTLRCTTFLPSKICKTFCYYCYFQDLLDYLTQLLGSDRMEQLRAFVDDVGRVQRGESLREEDTTSVVGMAETVPSRSQTATATPLVTLTTTLPPPRKTGATVPATKPSAPNKASTNNSKPSSSAKVVELQQQQQHTPLAVPVPGPPTPSVQQKTPPPKGKAKFECGCFGSMHKALTNCLYCGRISCEREGYDYCPFCGYLVEEVVDVDEAA